MNLLHTRHCMGMIVLSLKGLILAVELLGVWQQRISFAMIIVVLVSLNK